MARKKQLKPNEACEGLKFIKLGNLVAYSFLGYDYFKLGVLKDITTKKETGYKMITPKFIEPVGGKRVGKGNEYNIRMNSTLELYLFKERELRPYDILFTRNRLRPSARMLLEDDIGNDTKVASSALFVLRFKDEMTSKYIESLINSTYFRLILEGMTRFTTNRSISLENLLKVQIPYIEDKNKLEHLSILYSLDYKPDIICDKLGEMIEINKPLVKKISSELKDSEKRFVAIPVKFLEDHGIKKIDLIYDLERAIKLNNIILDK